jgi:hypothetical protein
MKYLNVILLGLFTFTVAVGQTSRVATSAPGRISNRNKLAQGSFRAGVV